MNWHDIIDERSLEMHRLIAEKIRLDPGLFHIAIKNLEKWTKNQQNPNPAILEWKNFIKTRSLNEVLDFICSWSEESRRMRQSSPFVGILTEKERSDIFQHYESLRA